MYKFAPVAALFISLSITNAPSRMLAQEVDGTLNPDMTEASNEQTEILPLDDLSSIAVIAMTAMVLGGLLFGAEAASDEVSFQNSDNTPVGLIDQELVSVHNLEQNMRDYLSVSQNLTELIEANSDIMQANTIGAQPVNTLQAIADIRRASMSIQHLRSDLEGLASRLSDVRKAARALERLDANQEAMDLINRELTELREKRQAIELALVGTTDAVASSISLDCPGPLCPTDR